MDLARLGSLFPVRSGHACSLEETNLPTPATSNPAVTTASSEPAPIAQPREVRVVVYGRADCDDPASHPGTTLRNIAERVAALAWLATRAATTP